MEELFVRKNMHICAQYVCFKRARFQALTDLLKVCIQDTLSSRALGLAVVQLLGRVRARARVSCIMHSNK